MKATATTLNYTVNEINSVFLIKVYGLDENGDKVNKLVGVSGLQRLVGDTALTNRLLDRAFSCTDDVCHCKLRRGVKISFYFH